MVVGRRDPMIRARGLTRSLLVLSLMAIATGLVAGIGAVVFRGLIGFFHNVLFLKSFSAAYNANVHTPPGSWGAGIILVPCIGALAVAFLVKNFAPEARGHGVPEVIDAIYYDGGVIRPVVAVVKSLASALSIGSGAAVGREGPIVQIGSAFGSTLGQLLDLPAWQKSVLIGCGAGGGIAATFNTPIGGLLFAVELILPEISARSLIPVTLATGAATFVGRLAFGAAPSFTMPQLVAEPAGMAPLLGILLLGVVLGVASTLFIRSIYWMEDLFDAMPGNYYSRHLLGMFIVGCMLYLFVRNTGHYYVEGVGYATVQDLLNASLSGVCFLLLLFAAKLVGTALALGSGASGGIFSPSLFLGATVGAAFATFTGRFLPDLGLTVPATALVGMAGLVAGATGAVATAIVMLFEMTRDYAVVIPTMIAASVAYAVRRAMLRDSIYTLKLSRRGHSVPEALQSNLYLTQLARNLLDIPFALCPLDAASPLGSCANADGRLPHLVGVRNGQVVAVLDSNMIARLDRSMPLSEAFSKLGVHDFALARADDDLLQIYARMREGEHALAIVTNSGRLQTPGDIVGVFGREQVAFLGHLPRPSRTK